MCEYIYKYIVHIYKNLILWFNGLTIYFNLNFIVRLTVIFRDSLLMEKLQLRWCEKPYMF